MNAIVTWLRSRNITAHSITAASIALAGLIVSDEKVRTFILNLFVQHPKWGSAIVLIAGIIVNNSNPQTAAAKVATAKQVLAQPDAPSAKAVEDVTPPQ